MPSSTRPFCHANHGILGTNGHNATKVPSTGVAEVSFRASEREKRATHHVSRMREDDEFVTGTTKEKNLGLRSARSWALARWPGSWRRGQGDAGFRQAYGDVSRLCRTAHAQLRTQ